MSETRLVPLGQLISPAKIIKAGDGSYPILSMTMHNGLMDQGQKFKKPIASKDLSGYKVVKRGQLVVSFPIDEGVLDFQQIYDEAIVSPAYGIWDVIDPENTDINYLGLALRSERSLSYYKANLQGSTARRRSLPREIFLAMPVDFPSLTEQRRRFKENSLKKTIEQKRERQRDLLAELEKSVFESLFGDYEGDFVKLGDIADITSGITKGRKISLPTCTVPYLAVANVQAGRLKLDAVKEIAATEAEIDKYRLLPGDVVITEGGDPDKLGRGTIWRDELPEAIHQNHIFRIRLREDSGISPVPGRLRSAAHPCPAH